MRTFKVISLSVSGHSNKIYRVGETVREDQFIEGAAAELLSGGHIEEVFEETSKEPLVSLPTLDGGTAKALNEAVNKEPAKEEGPKGTKPKTTRK